MSFISGMTITCFAACYVLALAVEVSRLLMRWRVPTIVPLALAAIGLLAHSLYLIAQAQHELAQRVISPLSSWYDFCLLAAWVLAGAYLGLMIRRSESAIGVFLLPLVLALIAAAAFVQDADPFPARTANVVWRSVHGMTLLLGTTAVTLGFATGLMYLLQSYRLKHKLPPPRGFRLPSLEWLQRFNRESLFVSTCLLAIGLVSGVALNLISKAGQGTVSWTDPVVLSSGVLFLWLTVVTIFESIYRPAREGSKVAYLTLANFVFLGLALYFVLFGSHATANATALPLSRSVSFKVAQFFRPERAQLCQPRATPWGNGIRVGRSPERATLVVGSSSCHPFRAPAIRSTSIPRALPWAELLLPRWGEESATSTSADRKLCGDSSLTRRATRAHSDGGVA